MANKDNIILDSITSRWRKVVILCSELVRLHWNAGSSAGPLSTRETWAQWMSPLKATKLIRNQKTGHRTSEVHDAHGQEANNTSWNTIDSEQN